MAGGKRQLHHVSAVNNARLSIGGMWTIHEISDQKLDNSRLLVTYNSQSSIKICISIREI